MRRKRRWWQFWRRQVPVVMEREALTEKQIMECFAVPKSERWFQVVLEVLQQHIDQTRAEALEEDAHASPHKAAHRAGAAAGLQCVRDYMVLVRERSMKEE